ncbi:hypothetical protein BO85DRAFT_281112 [Aspergillus piperis CBS 112811]|uniref:Secreted protein n=1 Tax=Aspergillus piperis CBS 112811 TaxID=1448313 RepID=A0A8G1VNM2_9EURO|nr:hypothetical protein BO85DRAFT_281112 [Aspergillus piperis CBS 112811]RAH58747.1 hypothetical protein BO85DRAFT_281112 [Aspergillus piperis CBS 112811]
MRLLNLAPVLCLLGSTQAISLGQRCLEALNAMSTVPGQYIATIERDTCSWGCKPRPEEWDTVFEGVIQKVVEDGARYTGIDDPKAQAAFASYLNDVFQNVNSKCGDRLGDDNLCSDSPQALALKQCVDDNAKWAATTAALRLVGYLSEDRCEKVSDYFKSEQLWNKDLPNRSQVYVQNC